MYIASFENKFGLIKANFTALILAPSFFGNASREAVQALATIPTSKKYLLSKQQNSLRISLLHTYNYANADAVMCSLT